MNDELGTRMKEFYENRSQSYLARRIPAIIRIDGKAFHTFTNKFTKPFDNVMIKSMQLTAKKLCAQIQGAKIAYTQSDEISLLLTDWDNLKTDAWFDYNIQKITSVSASMTTLYFNNIFAEICTVEQSDKIDTALFDARVFSIPKEDVNNYFWWRQIDCIRNSIQMLAQSNFSHKVQFHNYKNKPCDTCWNYDWDFTFIYLTVMKKQKRGSVYKLIESVWKSNNDKGDYTHNRIIIPHDMFAKWIWEQRNINKYYTSNYWGIRVVSGDVREIIFE